MKISTTLWNNRISTYNVKNTLDRKRDKNNQEVQRSGMLSNCEQLLVFIAGSQICNGAYIKCYRSQFVKERCILKDYMKHAQYKTKKGKLKT